MNLHQYGLTPDIEHLFHINKGPGSDLGRVIFKSQQYLKVITSQGEHLAQMAGKRLKNTKDASLFPCVGDWVHLTSTPEDDRAYIQEIFKRKTLLKRRKNRGAGELQLLASNVDIIFVVFSIATLNPKEIHKALLMAKAAGAVPILIINKIDLDPDLKIESLLKWAIGAEIYYTSIHEPRRITAIENAIPKGKTAVFLGASGVGKSSLINALSKSTTLETQSVKADGSGKHTTTNAQLLVLPHGGLVIDTPGLRQLHYWELGINLEEIFPEIETLSTSCKFRNCTHHLETGCAVQNAVQTEEIPREAISLYHEIKGEFSAIIKSQQKRGFKSAFRKG